MSLDLLARAPVGLLPVLIFLVILVYMDSYKLVNLKSVVESGNDLRDQNPATADAISVGFNLS